MTGSVLLVDDEENFLTLLGRYLTKDGFHVKTASNSLQAIDFMDQEAFDVAILDINLSPVDGITLLAELKKRSPVIMATAYPTPDIQNECMRRGASVFLSKPLDLKYGQNHSSLVYEIRLGVPLPNRR
jgi:DNA-binding NtrC family response regulator